MWALALAIGIGIGAAIGAIQGFIIAYIGVPSFIVTLGGLLTIRGLIWYQSTGAAVNGLDSTFLLIGGGAQGSIGGAADLGTRPRRLPRDRRHRSSTAGASAAGTGSRVRPMWAEIVLGVVGCVAVAGRRLVREQQLLAAGPRRPGRPRAGLGPDARGRLADPDRVPAPDRPAHRRDARDDLDRDTAAVRAVRLRVRRQSRRRRAGRHQHALDDPQDVRPDGHPVRPRRRDRVGSAQRRRPSTSARATSCTSSRRRSSAGPRSPAASGRSRAPCSAPSSCSRWPTG